VPSGIFVNTLVAEGNIYDVTDLVMQVKHIIKPCLCMAMQLVNIEHFSEKNHTLMGGSKVRPFFQVNIIVLTY